MLVGQGTSAQDEHPSDVWTVNAQDGQDTHTTIPPGDTANTDLVDPHKKKINGTPVPTDSVHAVIVAGGGSRRVVGDSERMECLALLLSLLALFLVVLIVPLLRERNDRDRDRIINFTARPTAAPTMPPTSARFSDIVNEILTHFESPTLEEDLRTNPNSPQYRAAVWMAEEDEHPATASLSYPLNQTDLEVFQFRQRYALVTLFYATGGEGWWKDPCMFLTPTRHVCEWRCPLDMMTLGGPDQLSPGRYGGDSMGVTCGNQLNDSAPVFDDLVLAVELFRNGLVTTIPDEIQGLDVLEVLHLTLAFVDASGSIPFEALANTLIVKRPILAQQISQELDDHPPLGIAPSLRRLSIPYSGFSGRVLEQPFLYDLTKLELLDLEGNSFSGTIPSSLVELTALTHLDLGWNRFTGKVMEEPFLYDLTALEFLDLEGNSLSGTISFSALGQLTALAFLNVGSNNFTGPVMEQTYLSDSTALEYLELNNNLFSGTISSALGELTALTYLDVGLNNFTGTLMEQPFLYSMTALESLVLYDNSFSGSISSALGELTTLTYLDLTGNELTGSIPTEIGNLGGSLISFYVDYNDLSGTFPTELGVLTNLVDLGLYGNVLLSGSLEPFCSINPAPDGLYYCYDDNVYNVTCSCCFCVELNGTMG